jgi:hypothetical protein
MQDAKWNPVSQHIYLNSGKNGHHTSPFTSTTERSFIRWHQMVPSKKRSCDKAEKYIFSNFIDEYLNDYDHIRTCV